MISWKCGILIESVLVCELAAGDEKVNITPESIRNLKETIAIF